MEPFLKDIQKVSAEVERRYMEKHGEKFIQATPEEIRALRTLSARLEHIFGMFANVDFGGEGY
jgi:hypothetical protein